MLVLSRKPNEGVEIDGGIRVVVLSISGDRVKLGFEAPRSTRIRRDELREEKNEDVEQR
jgi:carbon storage regulator CsrA